MKTCIDCGETKPLSEYTHSTKRAGGKKYPRSRCKVCMRPKGRHWARSSKYGITEEKFNQMLADQNHRCALCGTSDHGGRNWQVDHDHACCPGKRSCGDCVRSLLCQLCNLGLGSFQDDINKLELAIEYLKRQQPV